MAVHSSNIIQDQIDQLLQWLSGFGKTEDGGVTRLLYDESWQQAQEAVKEKMEAMGLESRYDAVGNVFGRFEGTEKTDKVVMAGSHIDSVVNGGIYDGAYGVAAAMLAVERLKQAYGRPKQSIEIVSFCEEEGSRFPVTFWGSGHITGRLSEGETEDLKDTDGISIGQAMRACEFEASASLPLKREDIDSFIELHVEQGGTLKRTNASVGVVSDIVGQRRYHITVEGESNHAGTTPMPERKDAVVLSSELITNITAMARRKDESMVATVGKMEITPNVPNVIASKVVFSLDVRHHSKALLEEFEQELENLYAVQAEQCGMNVSSNCWMEVEPVPMSRDVYETMYKAAESLHIPSQLMISGAGHDAQVMGSYYPTALLFVPSEAGVSHSPKEYTKSSDLEQGIKVLEETLLRLAY